MTDAADTQRTDAADPEGQVLQTKEDVTDTQRNRCRRYKGQMLQILQD
jgi:hypothetical protein